MKQGFYHIEIEVPPCVERSAALSGLNMEKLDAELQHCVCFGQFEVDRVAMLGDWLCIRLHSVVAAPSIKIEPLVHGYVRGFLMARGVCIASAFHK